jgi:hypothetical protein
MKNLFGLIAVLVLLAGCKSTYDVTLTNGMQFTGVSKPKLNKERGTYVFKNATGKVYSIPETRVRQVEPHVNVKDGGKFQNSSDAKQFNSSGR